MLLLLVCECDMYECMMNECFKLLFTMNCVCDANIYITRARLSAINWTHKHTHTTIIIYVIVTKRVRARYFILRFFVRARFVHMGTYTPCQSHTCAHTHMNTYTYTIQRTNDDHNCSLEAASVTRITRSRRRHWGGRGVGEGHRTKRTVPSSVEIRTNAGAHASVCWGGSRNICAAAVVAVAASWGTERKS